MGEAAEVTATIGYEALEHCTGDDLEVLTAFCRLANAVEDGDSSPGGVAVIAALKARPEALASLCSFMAFTPWISFQRALIPKGFDSYDVGFKGANSTSKLLPLTPAQSSDAHSLVMASCVRLFLLCATSELAPVLCSVDHFEHSVVTGSLSSLDDTAHRCTKRTSRSPLSRQKLSALSVLPTAGLAHSSTAQPTLLDQERPFYVRGEQSFQSVSFSARRWPAFARYHSNGCRLPVNFLQMPRTGVLVLSSCPPMVFGSLVRTLLRAALRILHCRELLEHAKHDINLPPRALSILCFACSSSCCPLGFVFAVCSLLNSSW